MKNDIQEQDGWKEWAEADRKCKTCRWWGDENHLPIHRWCNCNMFHAGKPTAMLIDPSTVLTISTFSCSEWKWKGKNEQD